MEVDRLRHILELILDRLPKARVIVAGDFNAMTSRAREICSSKGLKSLINDTPTHRLGGMLDQIFTNIPSSEAELSDTELSDHKLIKVQFKFRKQEGEIRLDKTPTVVT